MYDHQDLINAPRRLVRSNTVFRLNIPTSRDARIQADPAIPHSATCGATNH